MRICGVPAPSICAPMVCRAPRQVGDLGLTGGIVACTVGPLCQAVAASIRFSVPVTVGNVRTSCSAPYQPGRGAAATT